MNNVRLGFLFFFQFLLNLFEIAFHEFFVRNHTFHQSITRLDVVFYDLFKGLVLFSIHNPHNLLLGRFLFPHTKVNHAVFIEFPSNSQKLRSRRARSDDKIAVLKVFDVLHNLIQVHVFVFGVVDFPDLLLWVGHTTALAQKGLIREISGLYFEGILPFFPVHVRNIMSETVLKVYFL